MFGFVAGAPAFLWAGIAALSVPVIIHMLQSPTAKVIDFPCIRFLKACQKQATRRARLKNIILMLMRMALIFLIAWGLSRPSKQRTGSETAPDAPVSMVLVLDNSYSMGYVDRGQSRFERARQAAVDLLGTLRSGDEVAVVLMNETAEPVIRDFVTDHERVKTAIRSAQLSVLGTNVDPALREAIRLANKGGSAVAAATKDKRLDAEAAAALAADEAKREKYRRREIYLLTDLQAESWEPVLKSNFLKTVDTKASVFVVSFGRKATPNCFIESVTAGGGGADECSLTAQVRAVGAGSPGNVATLSVNERNVAQETFAVRPGAPTSVTLTARLGEPGVYRCAISLQEDGLAIDDRHCFTVEVGERSKVLVVDGDPSAIPSLGETFFLGNALNPGGMAGIDGPPPIDARIAGVAELPAVKLDDFRTVVLCNVPLLDGGDLVRLESFLREGGSVLVFLGGKVDAAQVNQWKFMPISLTGPVGDPSKKVSFGFGEVRGDHPLYKEPIDVRSARFFQCYATDRGTLRDGAVVLASFANNQPALVEGRFGKGKVLLFTSTCDIEWSNFPLRRGFLPWVHQLLRYLANQDTRLTSFRLRDSVKFQALAAHYKERISVADPSGKRVLLPPPQLKGGYAEAVYADTALPGMYQVIADKAFSNSGGFGVNLDVKESLIDPAEPEKLVAAAPPGMLAFVDGQRGDVAKKIEETKETDNLWPLLFKLALLMLLVESLFGNLISRAKRPGGARFPLFEVLRQRNPGVAQ